MPEVPVTAEPRTEFGKGAARRIRRANKVPAVLYGHGSPPRHVSLPGHQLMMALKAPNVLLGLDLDGGHELALPKDVQRDPVKGFLKHVDLLLVRRGERVTVEVPVHLVGAAAPDTLVTSELTALAVEAEATHLPPALEVSLDGLGVGGQVHAKDVALPTGTTLVTDPDALVVNVMAAPSAEQVEAELAEAEAGVGIVHEPTDEEQAAASAGGPSAGGGEAAAAPAGGGQPEAEG